MKRYVLGVCLILTLAATVFGAGSQKSFCIGATPLSWTFMDPVSAPGAFLSDGRGTYTQGVDGVANSEIKVSGTNDATIYFPGAGRKGTGRSIQVEIPLPISGSLIQYGSPTFAGGSSFLASGQMGIRNILGYPVLTPGQPATFYTRITGNFVAPDGIQYRWGSSPDDFTCPSGAICVPNLYFATISNQPEETAWVKVTYMPRNTSEPYSSNNADRWLVEGEFLDAGGVIQRSTLEDSNGGHRGQYSLPFKILLTALCPLP